MKWNRLAAAVGAGALRVPAFAGGIEVLLDGCRRASDWIFFNGSEFPGAAGTVAPAPDGVALEYDFSGGGRYVGCRPGRFEVSQADALVLAMRPSVDAAMNYRIVDATGRYFQGVPFTVKGAVETRKVLSVTGPWQTAWGGDDKAKQPQFPLKSLWIMVSADKQVPNRGTILLQGVYARVKTLPSTALTGRDFQREIGGRTVTGNWIPQLEGAMLQLTVSAGKQPVDLAISTPAPGRDKVERTRFAASGQAQEYFTRLPLVDGVNVRNRYPVRLAFRAGADEQLTLTEVLAGSRSGEVNLGDPRNSREIAASKFGTCTHFGYAPKPEGPFRGWYPRELLLDEIAACGFKFYREGLSFEKQPDGSFRVRPLDIDTIKMARERGLEQIVVIDMRATEPLDEFLRRVEAAVRDTRGHVRIYELGNEPHNFGDWRKKFGGPWNGWENGKVSEWVKEHTRYTNAAADLIKSLNPDAVVIGLGSCSPTNFHALSLGVTRNLDGVVDHPYTYSLPPEKIPFGWSLTGRDGVKIGDAEHTFKGLMESYAAAFREEGVPRKVWVTEFGFTTFWPNAKGAKAMYAGFSEKAQSLYLVRRFIESLSLPMIAATCQYDFLDDYGSSENEEEANFGLLYGDYTRKPAFYAVQRLNSLFAGAEPDAAAKVTTTFDGLHRSAVRGALVRDWDQSQIDAANGVRILPFVNPEQPAERLLAVWSMQPCGGEFNNRVVSFEVEGWGEFNERPVAIDLLTGDTWDPVVKFDNGKIVVDEMPLEDTVVLLKFFKR